MCVERPTAPTTERAQETLLNEEEESSVVAHFKAFQTHLMT